MNDLESYFKDLFYIPPEKNQNIGTYYASVLHACSNLKHKVSYDQIDAIRENYWSKYHRDDPNDLKLTIAQHLVCPLEDLPSDLMSDYSNRTMDHRGLFSHSLTLALNLPANQYNNNYFFEVIFPAYYNRIKTGLLNLSPSFGKMDETFLRYLIIDVIADYQRGFRHTQSQNPEPVSFIDAIYFYGSLLIRSNQVIKKIQIDDVFYNALLLEIKGLE